MASRSARERSPYKEDRDSHQPRRSYDDRRARRADRGEVYRDRRGSPKLNDRRRDERYSGQRVDSNRGPAGDDDGRYDRRRDHRMNGDRDRYHDRERDRRPTGRDGSPPRAGPSRRSASPQAGSVRPRSGSRAGSKDKEESSEDKAKPNFKPSGLLAAATKTVKHVDGTSTVLKYHEPAEARKPIVGWRLYVFKGKEQVDLLHIYRQSAYLIGRDRTVADIPVEHPSCSKQHAVIQFRQVHEKNEYGDAKSVVKPFIIDLESTNGTHVNDGQIPTSRYYELVPGDVIKFGESLREYVILHDEAA